LIWNTLDPSSGQAADVVLGTPDFMTWGFIYGPGPVQSYHGRLYLPDSGNSRIQVWNSIPTQNGVPADQVIGQPSSQSGQPNPGGISLSTLQRPSGVLLTDVGFYIADSGNGRIVARPPLP
jgi:hypothetical protein